VCVCVHGGGGGAKNEHVRVAHHCNHFSVKIHLQRIEEHSEYPTSQRKAGNATDCKEKKGVKTRT
jgi:hypothetical protein